MVTQDKHPQQNNEFGLPEANFHPLGQNEGTSWVKRIALLVGAILIVAGGILAWFKYQAYHAPTEAEQSTQAYSLEEEEDEDERNTTHPTDHTEDTNTEQIVDTDLVESFDDNKPTEKGTFQRVNAPQPGYYVIVGSFIDDDLAVDYARQLTKQGAHTRLLEPAPGAHFFRLAVAQTETYAEAQTTLTTLQSMYGPSVWILKY